MALYQGAASPLAEKTPPSCGNESGHDFSRAEKAAKSTRALQAADKLAEAVSNGRFASGHDFSRAVNTTKQ
jgi:hypothetical protein